MFALDSVVGMLGKGTSVNDSMILEAEKYCRAASRDVELRLGLEREFPGRILQVIYDDFVLDPLRHSRDIYR